MKKIQTDIAILGAGLTGLAIADSLKKSGLHVTLLEKENVIGGLAKTVEFNAFRFDLGGHRLDLRNNDLLQFIKEIINAEDLSYQRRISSVFLKGKYLRYPPQMHDLLTYKLSNVFKFVCDTISMPMIKKEEPILKNWLISRVGSTIHDVYFKDYTKKVWGLGTDYMSSDWAERRIGKITKGSLVKNVFKNFNDNKENVSKFYYPVEGIGEICQRLAKRINAKIISNVEITKINHKNEKLSNLTYRKDEVEYDLSFRQLISTIPVTSLCQYIFPLTLSQNNSLFKSVNHRDLILVFLILDQDRVFKDHWVYFPQLEIPFSRISEPKNWSSKLVSNNKTSLSVELFCNQNDVLWNSSDEKIMDLVIADLGNLDIIQKSKIKEAFVLRVPFAYPLLHLGYKQGLNMIIEQLASFKNLILAGRTGTHSYYDMNECLFDAMASVKKIIRLLN